MSTAKKNVLCLLSTNTVSYFFGDLSFLAYILKPVCILETSMREFRIGALEYEYCEEKCIKVHIPSDADLSKQSVLSPLI